MNQVVFALRWYFVSQVFGLAALPLALRLFRYLPDRGYGLSKPLGLLLAGWAFWLLTTFGWTHNTAGGILVALALLAAAGLALHLSTNQPANKQTNKLTNKQTNKLTNKLTNQLSWRTIIAVEIVFAVAFAAWCVVRAHMPNIETAGGEKWMESAFLNAVLRSDTFPPHDPWLSGFAISYYYFGYVIIAMLTRLAAVPSPIAFNLGIATLFALTCTGAFSLVYNLIAAEGALFGGRLRKTTAIVGGLLGPLLVAVMGNLEGLLEVLHARGIGSAALWAWLDIENINGPPVPFSQGSWLPQRFFWWWQASRVLQDYTPWGDRLTVIDEFPSFSFILGDMHPHVLGLPFVLLALALALNLYLRSTHHASRITHHDSRFAIRNLQSAICNLPLDFRLWEFPIYAICLGGLGFLNTWDFPIYLFVVSVAYTLASLRNTQYPLRITHYVSRFMLFFLSLLIAGALLYFPFWLGFQSQAGGLLPNLFNGTRLPHFLVMFGPLIFIAAAFVVGQARRERVRVGGLTLWTLVLFVGIIGVLAVVLGLVVLLIVAGVIPLQGPAAYLVAWLRNEPIPGLADVSGTLIKRSLMARFIDPAILEPRPFLTYVGVLIGAILGSPLWVVVGLIALIVAAALILLRSHAVRPDPSTEENSPSAVRDFVLLLLAIGALLALSVEYVYLRDVYNHRMNTVFKFYFQTWVLWGVAGAYALVDIIRRHSRMLVAIAGLLILAGLIYPLLAIPARAREYGGPPTLDGTAYLAQVQPDDYAAIAWLNEHVGGAPVILEAPGSEYRSWVYEGRISAHTGLPTLLGWGGHENQWRGNYDEPARREPDIERLYTSTDLTEVLTLLKKYDIQYVYIGPLERSRYLADGLAKFATLMDVVYDTGAVTIYRYRPLPDARP